MTLEQKLTLMVQRLGDECDDDSLTLTNYLLTARDKILNHRFPYAKELPNDVEHRYENEQIELAIVLYSKRGGEGQSVHSENGVRREWRSEEDILASIPRVAGIPE